MKKRGLFITFEGIEGSGKSTQIELLGKYFSNKGYDVVLTREPGGTKIGDEIRKILLSPENKEMNEMVEALLYAASRVQLVSEIIEPALKSRKVILCDRYYDSSLAYQAYGRGIAFSVIEGINKPAVERAIPDITFFLDISVEEGLRRATVPFADRIESESLKFHNRVREGFLELARKNPERFVVIDGTRKTGEIFEEIIQKMEEFLLLK
ncbi:MAG: dTMP kinase [Candidatus Subteraquimicrobiales bacterium]|nr:dTMP kinase [Candidatus Subteraquimicrobiales bacterium]